MSDETTEPRSNEYELARMEPGVKQRNRGNSLLVIGVLLFVFAWILVVFVPADIRAGDYFWTFIFAADVVLAGILGVVGYRMREQVKTRLQ